MITAAGYLRRSTTKQEQSLDGQREAIQHFAVSKGYRIIRWYCDDGISGASGDARPEFKRMLRDAEGLGDFQALICYDMSRFSRMSVDETGHYRFRLKEAGVRVLFSNEHDGGNDETGEMLRPMLQVQKRQYLRQTSRDVSRGMLQLVSKGFNTGKVSYGYDRMLVDEIGKERKRLMRGEKESKPHGWHVKLVRGDESELRVIRWLFDTYLKDEIGCSGLAQQLNNKGVPSPAGSEWNSTTINWILRNPIFKGELTYGERGVGKFHRIVNGTVQPVADGERMVVNPRDSWCVTPAPELAIVSADTWERVNAKLRARCSHVKRAQARSATYPLSGVTRCGDCGGPMLGMRHSGKGRTDHIYCCARHFRNKSCNRNSVRQQKMLELVRNIIVEKLFFGGNLDRLKKAIEKQLQLRAADNTSADALRRQLKDAKSQQETAARNMLAADQENLPVLNAALSELREKIKVLESELGKTCEQEAPGKVLESVLSKSSERLESLFNAKPERLKAILGELIEKIELRFEPGTWGRRKIRIVSACEITLKSLTTEQHGKPC